MPFSLPPLPYPPDALEAAIDKMTMEIHHGRHHKAYVDNLNAAIQGHANLESKSIEQLLREINSVPQDIRQKVINNGGGHANHTMFWEIMGPGAGGEPSGPLGQAIGSTFGSIDNFKAKIRESAVGRFGSGWAWLVLDGGKLSISSTANQDSPLMNNQTPILGVDVWEHAYYLRYQNKRADYVDAWWKVVNWNNIAKRFAAAGKYRLARAGVQTKRAGEGTRSLAGPLALPLQPDPQTARTWRSRCISSTSCSLRPMNRTLFNRNSCRSAPDVLTTMSPEPRPSIQCRNRSLRSFSMVMPMVSYCFSPLPISRQTLNEPGWKMM